MRKYEFFTSLSRKAGHKLRTNLIEDKGVDKCTPKTQEAYEILKELAHKLETEYVIYRP